MGLSTDGQLSFGYVFEEGYEFPWDSEEFEGDIDEWWRNVKGFESTVEYPYDEAGNYKEGFSSKSPEIKTYYDEMTEWDKANPLPVQLVNYCSEEYPMYILAAKHMVANRGYPNKVSLADLSDIAEAHVRLQNFLAEFSIEPEGEFGWWLSSHMY